MSRLVFVQMSGAPDAGKTTVANAICVSPEYVNAGIAKENYNEDFIHDCYISSFSMVLVVDFGALVDSVFISFAY